MNATAHKGVSIMLAVLLAAAIAPILFMDSADANPGDTEADPLVWWNNTIILLPEVVAGEITDPDNEVLEPPESLYIDWGDGQSQVENVDGYVEKGSLEVIHTYEETGSYHITCTPQKSGFTYETYELWMEISGAPTVYFYDGEDEITHIVAENGYGVGAYEDNYFTSVTAPANPTKEGKTFAGWYYNGALFDFETVIKAPTVLQAHWTDSTVPVEPDTITVYIDGHASTMEAGRTVGSLNAPAVSGYTFQGWFSDENRTVPVSGTTVMTDGMHLYTKYVQNTAPVNPDAEQITVIVDGKSVSIDEGKKVSDLTAPEKEGYEFVGWYADEECTIALDAGTVLTQGMHAYAKYNASAPADDEGTKDVLSDVPVIAIVVCAIGAIVAVVGLRYHPAIMAVGIVIAAVGGLDIGGIISLF